MRVVDSHTEGEPTRLILEGGPDLGSGTLAERRRILAEHHAGFRRFVLSEPRGFPAMVGALLAAPADPSADVGLIFFNNAGTLGMCGHATIGAVVTLAHLGRLAPGTVRIDTPVGLVVAELHDRTRVTVENVPARLGLERVVLDVPGLGTVTGDVAWGGNWFFLSDGAPLPLEPANIPALTAAAGAVRRALSAAGITGTDGAEIDHVEFFGPGAAGADSRNFVLCPGDEYDRSPCGTGTSAKLACLAAHGRLAPGATYVQESIIGSRFTASYRPGEGGAILPRITGRGFVTADTRLLLDPADPFPEGIGGR